VYVELLNASALALRRADPQAHVVLGGLHGRSWISLEQLYAAGAYNDFDSVAIHPYTRLPQNTVRLLRMIRAVMARHGDAGKPLDVTELSWPSSRERVPDAVGFAVTPAVQALRLTRAYVLLAKARQELRLRSVYWYTWMSRDFSPTDSFDYAGLVKQANFGGPVRKPAYRAFRRVLRRLAR
jgi:polysaccharide biosynthesis protein PslG